MGVKSEGHTLVPFLKMVAVNDRVHFFPFLGSGMKVWGTLFVPDTEVVLLH